MGNEAQLIEPAAGWRAELALRFARAGARTILAARRHSGPLQVQRPFYPEDPDTCHVYLLHPPGGVVGGDQLRIAIDVDGAARVLATTPAAGKLYRSAGLQAQLDQRLTVAADGVLEWLPQESIIFEGAYASVSTRVDLAATARFIGWEIVCLGRPAAAEGFRHGALRQRFEIWRDAAPLWIEASRFAGAAPVLDAAWGLRGHSVTGTLVCTNTTPGLPERVSAAWQDLQGEALLSVTQLEAVLACRYLGDDAEQARACFAAAWAALRPAVLDRAACPPRIWAT